MESKMKMKTMAQSPNPNPIDPRQRQRQRRSLSRHSQSSSDPSASRSSKETGSDTDADSQLKMDSRQRRAHAYAASHQRFRRQQLQQPPLFSDEDEEDESNPDSDSASQPTSDSESHDDDGDATRPPHSHRHANGRPTALSSSSSNLNQPPDQYNALNAHRSSLSVSVSGMSSQGSGMDESDDESDDDVVVDSLHLRQWKRQFRPRISLSTSTTPGTSRAGTLRRGWNREIEHKGKDGAETISTLMPPPHPATKPRSSHSRQASELTSARPVRHVRAASHEDGSINMTSIAAASTGAVASAAPPPSLPTAPSPPTPPPAVASSYSARVSYESAFEREWQPAITTFLTQAMAAYAYHDPHMKTHARHAADESDHDGSQAGEDTAALSTHFFHPRTGSNVSVGSIPDSMLIEDFDADIHSSPPASSPRYHTLVAPPPIRPLSQSQSQSTTNHHASSASSSSSSSSNGAVASNAHELEELERHSLAKGKLKILQQLQRRKEAEWKRKVEAGEATWQQLVEQEEEARRRIQQRQADANRTARLIDPRDHAGQRAAAENEQRRAEHAAMQAQVDWYWNGLPVAAIAIMRMLVYTHAFEQTMPTLTHIQHVMDEPMRNGQVRHTRSASDSATRMSRSSSFLSPMPSSPFQPGSLCRTWILSDCLFGLRNLIIKMMQNDPEPVSAAGVQTPLTSPVSRQSASAPAATYTPAPSASTASHPSILSAVLCSSPSNLQVSNSSALLRRATPAEQCARLVWLLNNTLMLMHLTRKRAEQRHQYVESKKAKEREVRSDGKTAPLHRRRLSMEVAALPDFPHPPSEWDSSIQVPMPKVTKPDDGKPSTANDVDKGSNGIVHDVDPCPSVFDPPPLTFLRRDASDYVFEQGYDRWSHNSYEFFFIQLRQLSQLLVQCVIDSIFHLSGLDRGDSARALLQLDPAELLELDGESDPLDQLLESVDTAFHTLNDMRMLPTIKTQVMQLIVQHITHTCINTILGITDEDADDDRESPKNKKPSSSSPDAALSLSTSLLSSSVNVGMRLMVVSSCLEDWSQRATAFTHPFVHALRLTLAPIKQIALFCLIEDKTTTIQHMDDLTHLMPAVSRLAQLALIQRLNQANPEPSRINKRIIKQLRKAIAKEEESRADADESIDDVRSRSPSTVDPRTYTASRPCTLSNPLPSTFSLSLDLSSQLGRFLLSSVDLPTQLTESAHFQFLKQKDEKLVL